MIFNEQPVIEEKIVGKLWKNVLATSLPTDDGAQAKFVITKQWKAIAGAFLAKPEADVETSVSQVVDVKLGVEKPDGTVEYGTTRETHILEGKAGKSISFTKDTPAPSAPATRFQIGTDDHFTAQDAEDYNFLIGLGGTINGVNNPAATFQPEPMTTYNIQPVNKYWVTFGDFKQGAIVNIEKIGKAKCDVDFTILPFQVTINHTSHGDLVIEKA